MFKDELALLVEMGVDCRARMPWKRRPLGSQARSRWWELGEMGGVVHGV